MTAIILTWNPDVWNDWDYDAVRQKIRDSGPQSDSWTISRNKHGIEPGMSAWLFKQGSANARQRGIVGHATIVALLLDQPSRLEKGSLTNVVEVEFDLLLPEADVLDVPTLETDVPEFGWRSIRSSGARIRDADLSSLRTLWAEHVGRFEGAGEEGHEAPGTYAEGTTRAVVVNRYERSPEARRACIRHHGLTCAVCGFDFQATYGDIGTDYIQVHHVVPISQIGPGYAVDPVKDLVPLCANCHVMAHRRALPFSVEELRGRLL